MSGRTMHVGFAKDALIQMIRLNGAATMLKDWTGTDQQAIQALESDPRHHLVFSDDCDSQGADGACLGHDSSRAPWKALTICNPYPELILLGEKPIENRDWLTKHRGQILIHAGASKNYMTADAFQRFPQLPYGAIVGVASIVACLDIVKGWPAEYERLRRHEHAHGRFCWLLSDVRRFGRPVACRGAQGLWTVPVEIRAAVLDQLRAVA